MDAGTEQLIQETIAAKPDGTLAKVHEALTEEEFKGFLQSQARMVHLGIETGAVSMLKTLDAVFGDQGEEIPITIAVSLGALLVPQAVSAAVGVLGEVSKEIREGERRERTGPTAERASGSDLQA